MTTSLKNSFLLSALCVFCACLPASAQTPTNARQKNLAERRILGLLQNQGLRNFDIRRQNAKASPARRADGRDRDEALIRQRRERLKAYRASAAVEGSPALQFAVNSFGLPKLLSDPVKPFSTPSTGDPVSIAKNFLRSRRDLFQLEGNDIEGLRLVSRDALSSGRSILHFVQSVSGVDVYEGRVKIVLNAAGQVIQAGVGNIIPRLRTTTKPALSEQEAVLAAYKHLGIDRLSGELEPLPSEPSRYVSFRNPAGDRRNPVRAQLCLFPLTVSSTRLAYRIFLEAEGAQSYEILVDAQDGSLLVRHDLTSSAGQARVWRKSPIAGDRELIDFTEGWIPPDGTLTTGNHVDAFLDRDIDGVPDSESLLYLQDFENGRASSPAQLFDFPAGEGSTGADPRDSPAAAVTSLFFWVNAAHDYFYDLGFNELSGNFQADNFGRGGEENDAVRASSQADFSNAFFATLPDGIPGIMAMGIFEGATDQNTDDLDSSYSTQVIFHEYAHGVTTRIVGGPYEVGCLSGVQSAGLGEGWSDYFAISYTDDPVNGAYLAENSVRGIRRHGYESYPFTYEDVGNDGFDAPHDEGEIWAAALWDLRKTLGWGATDQLVVDGLKLTPCHPSMIDARDGVLAALESDSTRDPTALAAAWGVFARHGMGYSASGFESPLGTTYNAAFDLPPDLQAGNRNPVIISRPPSFLPSFGKNYVYAIEASDPDGDELRYELTDGPAGMTVDPLSGVMQWMTGFTEQRVKVNVTDAAGGRVIHGFPLFPATMLQPGQPITIEGPAETPGNALLEVPHDAPVLQVKLRGGSGDPGFLLIGPDRSFRFSFGPGSTETVSVSTPQAGFWNIIVESPTPYAGVSLEASFPLPTPIEANANLTGLSGERTSETFYRVFIPPGTGSFMVSTEGGTGDVNLYVKSGQPAVCSGLGAMLLEQCVFDESSTESGNVESIRIDNPQPGDWFIDLAALEAYSGVTLTTSTTSEQP